MKKYFTLLCLALCTQTNYAQSVNDIGKISLSVVVPDNLDGYNTSVISKLESKLQNIIINSSLGAFRESNFVIYPKLNTVNEQIVEGGMQNIYKLEAELSLYIKQLDNNIIYSSLVIPIKGTGNSKENALTNALSKIQHTNPNYKNFIDEGKMKILDYYQNKCNEIINEAQLLSKKHNYEEAMSVLMNIPQEISECYNKAQNIAIETYIAYQNNVCYNTIAEAKVLTSQNKTSDALRILAFIDPSTECYKEAIAYSKQVEDKISTEEKRKWDLKMKQYENNVALEKERINAIKEIAVASYKRKPVTVRYNVIVR